MVQYNLSTIYKLCCKDANIREIYIGSTTNFRHRKNEHKSSCNNENDKKHNTKVYKFIRENGGFENWDMVEIEKVNATDKKHLCKNERRVIEQLKPNLNCNIPGRTGKEYMVEYCVKNAGKRKKYWVEYSAKNADEIKEKGKEYRVKNKQIIDCICGSSITKYNLSHHIKTKKHTHYLESLENIPYGSNFIFVD